ncbi:MAG: S8 family serine peptidase [Kiritimatiellia bacterium]
MAMHDGHPVFYVTCNARSADSIGTDEVWPGGELGFSLSGTNTVLGMWDGCAVRTTHVEFVSGGDCRITQLDGATNYLVDPHSTAVAGTLVAAGINTSAKGMAFSSRLLSHDWYYDFAEMAAVAVSDLRISNHSYVRNSGWNVIDNGGTWNWIWWGDPNVHPDEDYKFGFYSSNESYRIDQTVYDASTYLPVWASGNECGGINMGPETQPFFHWLYINGSYWWTTSLVHQSDGYPNGYDLIPPQGAAKNVLTVGAVSNVLGGYTSPSYVFLASFSSVGPTDDGRIKPDVVAQGVDLFTTSNATDATYTTLSGTSFAAPSVAGSLSLLQQLYGIVRGTNRALLASTLKGLAIHTADDCGNAGPDYSFGWGLMNTPAAAHLITNDVAGDGHAHIKEVVLPNGESIVFPILATNSQPLKVTVVWTDPPGPIMAPSVDPTNLVLVNDLDLRVISPSGATNMPWVLDPASPSSAATTGDNFRDNVEQLYVAAPTNGIYLVRVTHKGTLSNDWQDVSILISGNLPMSGPQLDIVEVNRTYAPTNTLEWAGVVGQYYRVQSNSNLIDSAWADLTGDISALRTNMVLGVEAVPEPDVLFFRVKEVP